MPGSIKCVNGAIRDEKLPAPAPAKKYLWPAPAGACPGRRLSGALDPGSTVPGRSCRGETANSELSILASYELTDDCCAG